jgi:hypothetical protein
VIEAKFVKTMKTYVCLLSQLWHFLIKGFLGGKTTWGHGCIIKPNISTNRMGRWFLTTKEIKFLKNILCCTLHFLKKSMVLEKLKNTFRITTCLFFVNCISIRHFVLFFTSFSKEFVINPWFISTFKKMYVYHYF